MMLNGILVQPIVDPILVEIEGTLASLQAVVNGYIQVVSFGIQAQAYVNEDGKALELAYNGQATKLCFQYGVGLAPEDSISGNMLLLGNPDEEGNPTDVPNDLIKELVHG